MYYAAKKVKEQELKNVRLMVFNIEQIENIFAEDEVDRFYINFCDPWPKARHAKRRLTHISFLEKYRRLLKTNGELFFKTDNRPLFDFSLEQFALAGLKVDAVTFDLHNSEYQAENIMTEYERKFSGFGEKINRCEVTFTQKRLRLCSNENTTQILDKRYGSTHIYYVYPHHNRHYKYMQCQSHHSLY